MIPQIRLLPKELSDASHWDVTEAFLNRLVIQSTVPKELPNVRVVSLLNMSVVIFVIGT